MNFIKEILKGALIGVANIIPGVSGGTMAVSMGIYDKIISSITNIFKQFKKSIITLIPFIIGAAVAIVGLSFAIETLFGKYPLQTSMTFIGLILGGLPVILKKMDRKNIKFQNILIFLLFFALIIGLQLLDGEGTQVILKADLQGVIKLLLIGILASATMVIPGVSGSMILMILGYYMPVISEIKEFILALKEFDKSGILSGISILLPFGIGIVMGVFAIAKIIEVLLKKCKELTYSGILGLVIASPAAILMSICVPVINIPIILGSIATFAVGFIAAFLLGK